ncbi:hypothetical protein [Bacteroides sedimenti]|uniref:Uncharacterized protein n=1 Tax=Bacteroides sedimenti TaxID=2136147 RepID=A0ABN6Z7T0_9BACE
MKPSKVLLLSAFIATLSFVLGSYYEGLYNKDVPFMVTDTVYVYAKDSLQHNISQTKNKENNMKNLD